MTCELPVQADIEYNNKCLSLFGLLSAEGQKEGR